MMTKDEALMLALEALEAGAVWVAINTIREALAQPEQKFVCSTGLCHYRKPPQFPTMLRKMWSGTEVQEWINENWSKT